MRTRTYVKFLVVSTAAGPFPALAEGSRPSSQSNVRLQRHISTANAQRTFSITKVIANLIIIVLSNLGTATTHRMRRCDQSIGSASRCSA